MAKKKSNSIKIPSLNDIRKNYDSISPKDIYLPQDQQLWLPSRSLKLNHTLGGGIPYGRIMEIYGAESSGKTLIAMDFAYVAQSCGGVVLFNDAEQAFDPTWAEKNGLDLGKIELCNEVAVEKVSDWLLDTTLYYRSLLTHNEPIVFIQDSLAALDCMDNINSKQSDSKAEMGNRAKAIYKMVRIRNKLLNELGIISIFINQVRQKVGAGMFEDPDCFNYNTLIPLVDGRCLPIGKIVEDNIQGEVYSLNFLTNQFEPKPITNWIKKEDAQKWLSIVTNGPGSKGGRFGVICTPDHAILTDYGWVNAKNLTLQHKVVTKVDSVINGSLYNFMVGSFMGDSSLKLRDKNTACFQLQDNENIGYINWKLDKLAPFFKFKEGKDSRGMPKYTTEYSIELANYAKAPHKDPLFFPIKTILTLAIWYMDDGHLSKGRNQGSISISHKRTNINELVKELSYRGYDCYPYKKGIRFTSQGFKSFSSDIASHIPECMQYKLLPEDRGKYREFELNNFPVAIPLYTDILSISEAGARNYRRKAKYDITVADNHNFLAGGKESGFIAHNTTPGGNAMKFFASQRLGIYAGKQELDTVKGVEQKVGINTSVRVKKNKVAPPKPTFKSKIYFNGDYHKPLGIDRYLGLDEVFLYEGVLTKKGNSFKFNDQVIAIGEKNLIKKLEKDPELRKELIKSTSINTVSKLKARLKKETANLYKIREAKHERETE
jgi:RecA/RadA recombinase